MMKTEEGTTVELGPAKEVPHSDDITIPTASPKKEKKKLQFHMANKVKIIPTNRQGQLNTGFLATLPGVLKIAEIVSLIQSQQNFGTWVPTRGTGAAVILPHIEPKAPRSVD
ncbi:hypothetical protein B9Z55_020246 [Caenorhabditis nigoni]|uniref:Uncharacterized protein n=1 Tax=Caenorhabditis nigoni TaxID=1611254 RepID=A0A2G5TLX6_9PELO|nr:hypothetical protein B9Z55_020246 [Caenorhabditis nigoni]